MPNLYTPEDRIIAARAFDSIDANIAILDRAGVIRLTNQSWRNFASRNRLADGSLARGVDVGANYLEICRSASGISSGNSLTVLDGIEAVLAGKKRSFAYEYPCHAPTEQRWFVMNIKPIHYSKPRRFIVSHADITARRLAEMELVSRQRDLAAALERLQQLAEQIKNSFASISSQSLEASPSRANLPADQEKSFAINEALATLSKRELQVLEALVRGERNSAIAERLQLSRKSVSTYRSRVLEKLKVETNADLVVLFHADELQFKQFRERKMAA